MEKRNAKLIINQSGGNASSGAKTFRVTIPNSWVDEMNINIDSRDIELKFDGENIVISKKQSIEEFINKRKGNRITKIELFNFNDLCTTIIADYTNKEIAFENQSDNYLYCAFGKNNNPTWSDYLSFLERRCISKDRDRLRDYLEVIGVDSFEPLEIIKKTSGRMAEDNQWIKVTEYEN
ncbi:MAG: AbrB/MazE/SpoVT family DNA-binding domain-containing protein [Eubacterium sp.]|nr:AbrB/MazE/SpoVT family DNA-binding domain-containing protein [Eubacterium sp.]